MNKKTFNFLKKLVISSMPLQLDDMSSYFDVTTRTMYHYWDEICDYLVKLDLRSKFSFDGKLFKCTLSEEAKRYLITSMHAMSFYEYKLSNAERQAIISIIYLISHTPVKNSDFIDILCVSQNTVTGDLREVRRLFGNHQITVQENKHQGIFINCSETLRRNLLLKLFDAHNIISDYFIDTIPNPCTNYLCSYMKLEKFRTVIVPIVKDAEAKLNLHMTDYDFYKTVTVLLIITVRSLAGFSSLSINETAGKPHYNQLSLFTEYIFQKLNTTLNIPITESHYFFDRMKHYKIISQAPSNAYNEVLFELVIHEFLSVVSEFYQYDLLSDELLIKYLNAHIAACCHRLEKNIIIENPYLLEMKRKYKTDYQFLKEHIYILENALHITFNDGEIVYILMHILTSIERNSVKSGLPNVVVICHGGLATSNYLSAQLSRHFKLNIITTCSIHNAKNIIEKQPVDLIISTIPVRGFHIPIIVVNALLMTDDINNLHETLSSIQNTASAPAQPLPDAGIAGSCHSLYTLLSPERILLEKEAYDWKEAIISAGELLLWDRLISVNYLHTMIELVVKYGPYIVIAPHIALTHAAPSDGAIGTGVSMIRLKNSVDFGKEKLDPVKIVIACSFLDTTDNANTLLQLMRIVLKPGFYSMALSAKEPQDILDYFK